jgi:hypothetical protein
VGEVEPAGPSGKLVEISNPLARTRKAVKGVRVALGELEQTLTIGASPQDTGVKLLGLAPALHELGTALVQFDAAFEGMEMVRRGSTDEENQR